MADDYQLAGLLQHRPASQWVIAGHAISAAENAVDIVWCL